MNKEIPKFDYGFYWDARKECFQKFGKIFSLPVIKNPYTEIISNYLTGNILDIGAGKDLMLYSIIKDKLKKGRYYSLDNDPTGSFDFNSLEDIPNNLQFSLICANQFFEHIETQEAIEIVVKSARNLKNGGKYIITIPNTSHPNRFLDITHKSAWDYFSFYMVYKYANLDVSKIARYSKRHPKGLLEKLITRYTSRVYRMDWCDSILMVGKKSS